MIPQLLRHCHIRQIRTRFVKHRIAVRVSRACRFQRNSNRRVFFNGQTTAAKTKQRNVEHKARILRSADNRQANVGILANRTNSRPVPLRNTSRTSTFAFSGAAASRNIRIGYWRIPSDRRTSARASSRCTRVSRTCHSVAASPAVKASAASEAKPTATRFLPTNLRSRYPAEFPETRTGAPRSHAERSSENACTLP